MKYKRFEDLPVWKDAIEFAVRVFEFSTKASSEYRGVGDLKNQLERAAVSISNNIAEGFERGTTTELIQFLYISKGSAGECRSITYILGRLANFKKHKENILDLRSLAEKISKQLNGWADSLKNSEIKGMKFLTEKERESYKRNKDLEEFDREMKEFRANFAEKLKREQEERNSKKMDE
jgi:four helix bundle protein